MEINTISVYAKEWFDKVNGTTYFSAKAIINEGEVNAESFNIPFQYGYGEHYLTAAIETLDKANKLPNLEKYENGSSEPLWHYCERKGIKLIRHKSEGHKRKDL